MAQIFPRWTNQTPRLITLGALAGLGATVFAVYWWASPYNTDVGYAPKQPVPYSHKLHAGDLKMDCRYCHVGTEQGPAAGVPPTQTCMNCHKQVKTESDKLKLVRESWATDKSIEWVRIHKLPEHAKFPHFMHVNAGLQCQTCHGPVQEMKKVYQFSSLRMGWCIDCHRGQTPLSAAEEASVRQRSSFVRRVRDLGAAGNDTRGVAATRPNQRATTDCVACHY